MLSAFDVCLEICSCVDFKVFSLDSNDPFDTPICHRIYTFGRFVLSCHGEFTQVPHRKQHNNVMDFINHEIVPSIDLFQNFIECENRSMSRSYIVCFRFDTFRENKKNNKEITKFDFILSIYSKKLPMVGYKRASRWKICCTKQEKEKKKWNEERKKEQKMKSNLHKDRLISRLHNLYWSFFETK